MDYSQLSLIELKQMAKGRRIKQYYIKKKEELAEILSLTELPFEMKLEKMTIIELREEAKRRGLRGDGIWKLNRQGLVNLLYPRNQAPANQNKENQSDTNKHDDPKEHDSQ